MDNDIRFPPSVEFSGRSQRKRNYHLHRLIVRSRRSPHRLTHAPLKVPRVCVPGSPIVYTGKYSKALRRQGDAALNIFQG